MDAAVVGRVTRRMFVFAFVGSQAIGFAAFLFLTRHVGLSVAWTLGTYLVSGLLSVVLVRAIPITTPEAGVRYGFYVSTVLYAVAFLVVSRSLARALVALLAVSVVSFAWGYLVGKLCPPAPPSCSCCGGPVDEG